MMMIIILSKMPLRQQKYRHGGIVVRRTASLPLADVRLSTSKSQSV
jgi:hypothetical protein